MAIEDRFAAFTVSDVALLTVPELAEIVVVPKFTALARPLVVMEATEGEDDIHVRVLVTFCVVPSEKVPVAVNG